MAQRNSECQDLAEQNRDLESELMVAEASNSAFINDMSRQIATISRQKAEVEARAEERLTEINHVRRERDELRVANRELDSKLRSRSAQPVDRESTIRQELVGLRGAQKRVVILFDASHSMTLDNRWELARDVASAWIEHLQFEACALIIFNRTLSIYPTSGSLLRVTGSSGRRHRHELVAQLRDLEAGVGGTDTLGALKRAYRYPYIDTLILFTDGKPSHGGDFKSLTRAIHRLTKRHSGIPINVVGLGNYFDPELSEFLLKLASDTGGVFIGR